MADAAKAWTDDELTQMKTLVSHNTPTPLIASKLGRTEDSVRSKAQAEGISLAPANRSPAD